MFSRRKFLKIGSFAAAGGLILSGNISLLGQTINKTGYFQIPLEVLSDKSTQLNRQTFEPLLNAVFSVRGENSAVASMRLVEITGTDSNHKSSGTVNTDRFSLIFEIVGKGRLDDKIYEISNSEMSEQSIFVSTVGRSGKRFQAVFNRVYL